MKAFDDLMWRGLIKDMSDEARVKSLLNDHKIKFYCGFDPTGESLTVGHLVQIVRMKLLQSYGHQAVALIGGATGLIGDPRQTSERKLLSLEESLGNANKIKDQISRFLDEKETVFVNNYDWISKIDTISFLRDYGKHFNINYMLAKETIQSRLNTGISYTEFSYMLLQSIDFLHLYETMGVKVQFGGSDQWGNITSGLELMRKIKGEHDAVGLSSPLLLKSDGTKFGKSESGALWLDDALTSPYELYQYFLNTADADVVTYLKTLTLLKKEIIEALEVSLKEEPEKREAHTRLASEVVLFVHGKEALEEAQTATKALFSNQFETLSKRALDMLVGTLFSVEVTDSIGLLDALVQTKLAKSNREARDFIQSGAISINGVKASDMNIVLKKEDAMHGVMVLKRGKKLYAAVKWS